MEAIWEESAIDLHWFHKWHTILDYSDPPASKWFVGGKLNICYNAVDRHVLDKHGDEIAFIYESPPTNTSRKLTYRELLEQVSQFAGGLQNLGVGYGDSVVLFVPNVLEAVVAYLACLRLGILVSCWSCNIAIPAMVNRMEILQPKIVITTNYGLETTNIFYFMETMDKVLSLTEHQPKHCIVIQRPSDSETMIATLKEGRDLDYEMVMKNAKPCECVSVESNEPALILYTSGTVSDGKAMVFTTGGVAVGCINYMKTQWNDCKVLFSNAPLGWIPGPTITLLGPLLLGKTAILYEGYPLTPDPGIYFKVIARHNADSADFSIGSLRALVLKDPNGEYLKKHKCNSLRAISAGGETCGTKILKWVADNFNLPLQLMWGQTELGGINTYSHFTLQERSKLPPTCVGNVPPGYDVRILDDNGNEVPTGTRGHIVFKTPLPPLCAITIFKDHARYMAEYFTLRKEFFHTKDIGEILPNGTLNCIGRSDAMVKIADARICLTDIEKAINNHENILEALAVAVNHKEEGHQAVAFYIVKNETAYDKKSTREELIALVDETIGPESTFKYPFRVTSIPKMKVTGKLARNMLTSFLAANFPELSYDMSTEEVYTTMELITTQNDMFQ